MNISFYSQCWQCQSVSLSTETYRHVISDVTTQLTLIKQRLTSLLKVKHCHINVTLVTGSIKLTPCLLIAISNVSGKLGSVDCCKHINHRQLHCATNHK